MSPSLELPSLPLIKWVGGKRKLLPTLFEHVPNLDGLQSGQATFFEPFIGGAAFFMHLQAHCLAQGQRMRASINDFNPELYNLYCQVRDNPERLGAELSSGRYRLDKDAFLAIRAWDRDADWDTEKNALRRAARFLYLNKTAFNGVWRVNASGFFNVPYANPKVLNLPSAEVLNNYATLLKDVAITQGDFEAAVATAVAGDVVYFDPPYAPVSATASFTGYTKDGFDSGMQHRLAALLRSLSDRGIHWMLSNSDTPFTREVFGTIERSTLHTVQMARSINRNRDGRGKINEILVVSEN